MLRLDRRSIPGFTIGTSRDMVTMALSAAALTLYAVRKSYLPQTSVATFSVLLGSAIFYNYRVINMNLATRLGVVNTPFRVPPLVPPLLFILGMALPSVVSV